MHEAFGEQFQIQPGYLNTASTGVPPLRVGRRVASAVEDWYTAAHPNASFDAEVDAARAAFATLVGADPDRVAIGSAVSSLIGMVAAGVPDGTRVLTAAEEFGSVVRPFAVHADRGVTITEVDLEALPERVADHDLVTVSVTQSRDGRTVDLAALRAAAERTGARVLLDVSQAAGWQPLSLGWADWLVGVSHKWLLSTNGACWLACSERGLAEARPSAASWYAADDRWNNLYGASAALHPGARGLDTSPIWHAHLGAAEALPWLVSLDLASVRAHCVGLADLLLERLDLAPRDSAIVALDLPDGAGSLAEQGIAASVRSGRVRLSFHLYNTEEDVDRVVRALRS
ncbi:aminotransferase class V-fold PLP-dependent enzyme [Actinoalloteichus hymeniacidonis]|uniref:Selenocysteine lyase n=1 Tax=Actinoalloteichus hymeniacidonis TaxID=340345 RepID=A0AAC9HNL3_9PSEU|nr:aminotransferase class V-fold PLP-dependent enzyme [Actinoalloteichus hymeniacidonis]AOS62644.1 selenocysteine lyase [Actinoalloteichus hymeniacidonis]MBB5909324.1 selenocysteine lyase/cysteine desulfurase [Actinoalloteichus hymeniacidonis]